MWVANMTAMQAIAGFDMTERSGGMAIPSTSLLGGVDWKCVRCGCTESTRWSICVATDGTKQAFCLDCHRAGYEGGFSYIGDEVFTPNAQSQRTPKAAEKGLV